MLSKRNMMTHDIITSRRGNYEQKRLEGNTKFTQRLSLADRHTVHYLLLFPFYQFPIFFYIIGMSCVSNRKKWTLRKKSVNRISLINWNSRVKLNVLISVYFMTFRLAIQWLFFTYVQTVSSVSDNKTNLVLYSTKYLK